MLVDDKHQAGDAKATAGLLMAIVVCANAVFPKTSLKVTPILYDPEAGLVV